MLTNSPNTRRRLRDLAAIGTVLAATMLVFDVAGLMSVDALPPGSPAAPGMVLSPTSGDSSTAFTLDIASPGNTCPGDSSVDGYRWQGYITSASVDPGTLTYTAGGPVAPAGAVAFPLLSAIGGSPQVNKLLGTEPKGQIIGTSTLNFAQYPVGTLAAGSYKIGIACTKAGVTEKFWVTDFVVTSNPAGGPSQFSWTNGTTPTTTITTLPGTTIVDGTTTSTVVDGTTTSTTVVDGTTTSTLAATTTTAAATTTTAAATTTTAAATTTTVARTTTTTTTPRATTTTAAATTTTSTLVASAGATTTTVATAATLPFNSGVSSLPVTGSNHTLRALLWAVLVLVLGRVALLLSRPAGSTTPRR